MADEQLNEYIRQARQSGMNETQIRDALVQAGWDTSTIQNVLQSSAVPNAEWHVTSKPRRRVYVKAFIVLAVVLLFGGGAYAAYFYFIQPKEDLQTSKQVEAPKQVIANQAQENTIPESSGIAKVPEPPYYVVLSGEIGKDTTVSLNPFFFTTSKEPASQMEPQPEAVFTVEMLDGSTVLASAPIDAFTCADIPGDDQCLSADHTNGFFVTALFTDKMPDALSIKKGNKEIYHLAAQTTEFPALDISQQDLTSGVLHIVWKQIPVEPKLEYEGYISNNGFSHTENSIGTTVVAYHDANGAALTRMPDGTTKDIIGDNELTFNTWGDSYMAGTIQAAVYATDGFRTRVFYSSEFKQMPYPVHASIKSPENGKTYEQNHVDLMVNDYDAQGNYAGPVTGNTYTWTSDKDGQIATTKEATCQSLAPGNHVITLHVKNENGTEDSASVTITVTTDTLFWNQTSDCDDPSKRGGMTKAQCLSYYATVKYENEKDYNERRASGHICE